MPLSPDGADSRRLGPGRGEAEDAEEEPTSVLVPEEYEFVLEEELVEADDWELSLPIPPSPVPALKRAGAPTKKRLWSDE